MWSPNIVMVILQYEAGGYQPLPLQWYLEPTLGSLIRLVVLYVV